MSGVKLKTYVLLRRLPGGNYVAHDVFDDEFDTPEERLQMRMEAAEIPGEWWVAEVKLIEGREWPAKGGK